MGLGIVGALEIEGEIAGETSGEYTSHVSQVSDKG